ncbi:MAG: saccharopine dehydrogenase NADP-binding domain-containing protein [Phenylobacterium sp.]|uniref:saccharopine dehydrogenase family protein n=1 Tax=Phenylobacterium sp. TaxID=1871053 RepID=UPI001A416C4C|nr:saccharopine dehydrogenase NADP-binding domain-containing protein [Phenylobacterium sp.]MBL8774187.1 saccharopine dehydrogenase NADP-binding domain-containing protein [Phenylobacterium sp.]
MNPNAQFDLIVYGATGYTGRLVAEHLAKRYGVGGEVTWAMAGRSADKLAAVRDEIGAPKGTPLIVADASDPASLAAMVARAKAVITTVGPYQLYGNELVAACVAAGTDCLDLSGEPNWMRAMIDKHDAAAKASGARIVHSCGFDSIPFEAGVWFCQETAKAKLGHAVPRVKARIRGMKGGLSGGTAASGAATMAAIQKDPSLLAIMMSPFGLTPGFEGPPQPPGQTPEEDPDVGPVSPFMMAVINSKNVHRSNLLMGHPYGRDFVYDEMAMGAPGSGGPGFTDLGSIPGGPPKPGEGPTKEERETGFYDILFIGIDRDGRQVRVAVKGDMDPGYGSTSKMLAETAIALVRAPDVPGGVLTPAAALQGRLVERLEANAGLSFVVEG